MATNFPSSADSFTNPTSGDTLDNPPHDQQHANINDAMEAVQASLLDGAPLHIDDANERVGVGTSSPQDVLHVVGDVTIEVTDDGSLAQPEVTLHRESATPADGDYLGQVKFAGKNDAGQTVNYAKITGKISDVTDGTEDGLIEIANIKAGSQSIGYRFTSSDLKLLNGRGLEVDGDVGVGTTSASHKLHVDSGASGGMRIETDNDSVLNFRTRNNARAWNVGNYYTTWNGLASPFIIQPTENSGSMDISITPVTNSPTSGLIIKADGRVCVGGDTNPAAHFTVKAAGTGANDGLVEFHSWSGSASSPTEVEDWPTPVLALRAYDDFYAQTMLSFGYPQDAIYQTGNHAWMFRLESGYGATQSSTSTNLRLLSPGGSFIVGTLSKSAGTFRIAHPLPELNETHDLVHSFVESPQADNLYRGHATLVDGVATVNLDEAAEMTEGTFVLLNRDIQCFTSNEDGWTAVRGSVTGNVLTIEAQDSACVDTVSWLVIGERQDDEIKASPVTDEDGHIVVEPLTNRVSESDISESEVRMEAARQEETE